MCCLQCKQPLFLRGGMGEGGGGGGGGGGGRELEGELRQRNKLSHRGVLRIPGTARSVFSAALTFGGPCLPPVFVSI